MTDKSGAERAGRSIATKAAALVAVAVVVGVAVLVAIQAYALRATAINGSLDEQRILGGLLAEQMSGGMRWGKHDLVQGSVDTVVAQSDGDIAHILVTGRDGALVAGHGADDAPAELIDLMRRAASGAAHEVDGEHVLIAVPIGEFGVLGLAWDLEDAMASALAYKMIALAAGLAIAITLIGAVALFLSRAVARPLEAITQTVARLAEGDTSVEAGGGDRRDEIGRMARAVVKLRAAAIEKVEMERDAEQARMAREHDRAAIEAERLATQGALARVVEGLGDALSRLAEGDVTHRVNEAFPPEYERLRHDLNRALDSLQEALGRISANAETVRTASASIAQASDELSSRTESQAASLEQSAAAIEEIAATTRKTAEGAAHAAQLVASAKGEAEAGGDVVRDAVAAMSEIETSSEKIGQIIGVIDEIAFQTNLLALNAGVEAARAGEAGRGFAVVAQEVRGLAQRSADAAKQIKGLILSSKTQVERGVELVDGAGAALERIISGVAAINEAVQDIAGSAHDQATGLQEVNSAVGQMDQFTQQNASMVERVTTSVRQLSAQTTEFADLIGRFRTGSVPSHARPAAAAPARATAARAPAITAAPKKNVSNATSKPAAKPAVTAARPTSAEPKATAPTPAPIPAPARKVAAGGGDAGWEEF
jgi:methyl-accepting chemotaxis protein